MCRMHRGEVAKQAHYTYGTQAVEYSSNCGEVGVVLMVALFASVCSCLQVLSTVCPASRYSGAYMARRSGVVFTL